MGEESGIEDYLVYQVRKAGGDTRKVKWIGRKGAPDRRIWLPRFIRMPCWVELKAPGKTPEEHQAREHERMRSYGEEVYVLDSREMVDKLIRGKL